MRTPRVGAVSVSQRAASDSSTRASSTRPQFFVLEVHAAEVGGQVEVVGYEDDQGLGVGTAEVGVDGGEFFFFGSAGVEQLQVADEDDLKRHHERGRLGEVEGVEDGGVGKVEVVEAKVALVFGKQRGQDAGAAALVEEGLVADEDVAGLEVGGAELGEEAVGGGEGADGGGHFSGRLGSGCRGHKG
jgi:hypothetical protein